MSRIFKVDGMSVRIHSKDDIVYPLCEPHARRCARAANRTKCVFYKTQNVEIVHTNEETTHYICRTAAGLPLVSYKRQNGKWVDKTFY